MLALEHATLFLGLACTLGFFMAWGVGANDVANAMGTSVGSKALSLKQAVIIAAIFETAGSLLAGGEVTETIRGQIIDFSDFSNSPELLIYGMLAALLASGVWLLTASFKGWPVSTTHTIVGAIIGFGWLQLGIDAVYWEKVMTIFLSWIVTPMISGVIAYTILISIERLIINTQEPLKNAKRYAPIYTFFASLVIVSVTLSQGLKHVGLRLTSIESGTISVAISLLIAFLGALRLSKIKSRMDVDPRFDFASVEKIFGLLMIFTASAMAFAHGSNDVANAIGPIAAIVNIIQSGGDLSQSSPIPFWVLSLGALGIVTGLGTYGYKVIATIGNNITPLTPSRGFAAAIATASTVILATGTGLPVSTTQTLVGAVLGVGMARGVGALNLKVIRNIFMSWVITLPAGAALAVIFFEGFLLIF